ncbi:polymorphic toxin type 43 domain-containing protein [Tenacibaculum sp.]|uniref:polymorphic toxin type 43 domain-containing protein n=1 Tax=Tenacibaculum sp. TaxID=1906242 RepID=UPI003AA9BF79
MKKVQILLSVLLLLLTSTFFAQEERLAFEPIDGDYPCEVTIKYNNIVLGFETIPLSNGSHTLTFSVSSKYCYEGLKVLTYENWFSFTPSNFFSGGTLTVTIPSNDTPNKRYASISLVEDAGDEMYGLIPGGNIRIEQQGNPNLNTYYLDSDRDGFGNYDAKPIYASSTPASNELGDFVTNKLDYCPFEASSRNNGCEDDLDDRYKNWVKSKSYDITGKLVGAGKSYYDDLGKLEQSQSYDIKKKNTWASQTFYDSQGRPGLQTLSAPITPEESPVSFGFRGDFVKKNDGSLLTTSDVESEDVANSVIIKPDSNPLGSHYANREAFQDQTTRPYSRTLYSTLNPGAVKQTVGGNKHDTSGDGTVTEADGWKRGYSFSMPAAQEMYYVFGYNAFPSNPSVADTYTNISAVLNNTNNHIVWLKAGKSVVQDEKGNEAVVFTDADGKTLGAARAGGAKQYEVLSLIGEQKYIDIHIPEGCNNTATLLGNPADYKIYNLKTEKNDGDITKAGFYRVEYIGANNLTKSHALTYIDGNKKIQPVLSGEAVGVRYKVNYYDYSLNYYNEVGQLTASLQPLGFNPSCLDELKATVSHDDNLKSSYSYNSLGQLVSTTSPDEGMANFKYRKDGQIRFSQNSKQAAVGEFSYTNYDALGRPTESGVASGTFSTLDGDMTNSFSGTRKEQHFTEYDYLSATSQTRLNSLVSTMYETPTFLSGNVAYTYNTNESGAKISETFYSYDVYGRVKWMVQKSSGLSSAKTIDYEYDPVTGQVTKVYFQKNTSEQFIHWYSYDPDTQALTEVKTSTDGSTFTPHATYKYYKNGALKRTELAGGIQGIDYVYNLNGQLKGINHPDLTSTQDPGGDNTDLFGLQLNYHVGDYIRDSRFKTNAITGFTDQFNGNIKAMKWNTKNNPTETSTTALEYRYKYDKNNWLQEAKFNGTGVAQANAPETLTLNTLVSNTQDKQATNSITLQPGFEVKASTSLTFSAKIVSPSSGNYQNGDYDVNNITYDANGNILSLNRNKNTEGGDNGMDALTYEYKGVKSNKLDRVIDAKGNVGVQDIGTQNAGNYVYNSIGQLIENKAEKVTYEYNASGLVTKVLYNDKVRVAFVYDDKGQRLQKISYNSTGTPTKTTNYVRNAAGSVLAIYEGTTLKELPIYGANRLGVYNKETSTSVYQLTDHLGNVRAVIAKQGSNAVAISRTDYYPFGMPMPNRQIINGEPYRYAYQGQEKDPETGKEAFQLRLWDARIGRWLTTDPKREFNSPYLGMGNNPMNKIDPDGGETDDWYLNLKTGKTEWHEGSADLSAQGLINVGDDNASWGEIHDNIAVLGFEKIKAFTYDTRAAYSIYALNVYKSAASDISNAFLPVDLFGSNLGVKPGKGTNNKLRGSGPAPGVIEVSKRAKSLGRFSNYRPKNSVEFIFDPKSNTLLVGNVKYSVKGLSPHQNLALSLGKSRSGNVVGGMFKRNSNGDIMTNEMSGHYWKNWTPEVRTQFNSFMKSYTSHVGKHNHSMGPSF